MTPTQARILILFPWVDAVAQDNVFRAMPEEYIDDVELRNLYRGERLDREAGIRRAKLA